MPRCARNGCGRWRPGILVRLASIGLRLDAGWYCSSRCLEAAARRRLASTPPIGPVAVMAVRHARLGGLLARQQRLPNEVVQRALAAQASSGLRLGTQLVELGVVSQYDVLRALATQGGVGFLMAVDVTRLRPAPGNLSPHAVRSLGLVPFEADHVRDVLKVACTAPVPRAAIAALRQLTGSIIEAYLVSDDQFPALLDAYGVSPVADVPAFVTSMRDVEAVAAHVVEAARSLGGVRMSEARCDDGLWVRLEGGGRTEDLWLTRAQPRRVEPHVAWSAPLAEPADAITRVLDAPRPRRTKRNHGPVKEGTAPVDFAVPSLLDRGRARVTSLAGR